MLLPDSVELIPTTAKKISYWFTKRPAGNGPNSATEPNATVQDLFKKSFSIFCSLHFEISIKSVSLLQRDHDLIRILLHGYDYALNSPLM
jgi:hypothetical protein